METTEAGTVGFRLQPFRALRLADSRVGTAVAHRALSRPYRAVPGRMREWRRQRHLRLDPDPVLYVHEYTSQGVSVRGLVGSLDLAEAERVVFPHEQVDARQVRQLAHRMDEMGLNPAPILLMHQGDGRARQVLLRATDRPPDLVYTDRGDQLHRLWRVDGESTLAELEAGLLDARTIIADGHHRFAAALRQRDRAPGTDWSRTLVMLIDQADSPLQLCAIHRTVPRLTLAALEQVADRFGHLLVRHESSHAALAQLDRALVLHDGERWATLAPRLAEPLLVCWLHDELLPALDVAEERLQFHHSASAALARAGQGVSILLPAPGFDHVAAAALSGRLMPPKATSFQPKPHLGVLMRAVPDE